MKTPKLQPLSEDDVETLLAGRKIKRDGVWLSSEQWMVKRIAEQGGYPSLPPTQRSEQWWRKYRRLCREQDRLRRKEQELRAEMEAHVASSPSDNPKIELTPPFLLKGQKRKKGHREFARRDSDLSEEDTQVLDAINYYQDCFYELLHEELGEKKWTRDIGISHPSDLAMRELFGMTEGDEDFEPMLKAAATRRKNRARQRRRTRRKNSAS